MADTRIKAGQFFGVVGHGTDGYFLMTNADGTMSWAEGGASGPSVTSVDYPGDDTAADPAGGQTVVLTGTGFAASGMTVSIGGTTAPSVAHDSNTQLTITTPAKAAGDYDIVVTNTVTGASGTFVNGISYNGIPTWTTAAGSLGTFESETTISTITLQATEPDGGTITFNITNGALPTGLSLTGANIDGTTTAESSTTLYSFTIEAIDDENQSTPRNFSITVNAAALISSENFTINTYTGNGSTQSIEGKIGTAASFNSSSQGIVLPNDVIPNNDYTLSFWFQISNWVDQNYIFLPNRYGSTSFTANAAGQVIVFSRGTSSATELNHTINFSSSTSWHNIIFSKSSTNGLVIYVDGVADYTDSNFTDDTSYYDGNNRYNAIGASWKSGSFLFGYNGKVDQVRILSKAILSSDVTTLYGENNASSTASTTDIFGDGSGVALYEFEEGAKDTGGVTGYIGSGGVFNGSSSAINLGSTNQFASSGVSVSMWINPSSVTTSQVLLGNGNGGSFAEGDLFIGIRTDGYIGYEIGQSSSIYEARYATTTQLTANAWQHILMTFDSSLGTTIGRIYVNGTLQSTSATYAAGGTFSGDVFIGTLDLQLGKRNLGGGELWYNGKIDQVRIFNKAISSSEVTTLYGETSASATKSTTDIFDDGSAVALYELEGNANNSATYIDNVHTTNLKINLNTLVEDSYSGGSTWSDLTTNGNDGTIYGATVDGDSLKFGAGDYVSIPDTADIVNSNFTIEVWFKLDSTTNQWNALIGKGTSDNSEELTLMIRPGNNVIYFDWGTGGQYVQPSYTWQANVWYHFAMTFGTNGIYFWVNGQKITGQSANPGSTTSLTNDLRIGSARNNTINMYGNISQFRYYDSVLADNTIISNYNSSYNPAFYNGTATNVLYAYDGTPTNVSFVGTSFQPDFLWVKRRDGSMSHSWANSVSGTNVILQSNETGGEASGALITFNTNGYSFGDGNALRNTNGASYVAWAWKAGGAAVSNTNGDITSQVSANQDAGFSIVEGSVPSVGYTNTFGHGLSSAPELIIYKCADIISPWYIFSNYGGSLLGNNNVLRFDTSAATSDSLFDITSTTFKTGASSSAHDFIAYCFHSIDGYQKVGSYTGSGTSLNTISVGFAPRFVLFKRTDSTGGWRMFDSTRGTDKSIRANSSDAEYDDLQNYVDFTSDGFEFNRTVTQENGDLNAPSGTYIYLAIA